jgi:hypothetical protein
MCADGAGSDGGVPCHVVVHVSVLVYVMHGWLYDLCLIQVPNGGDYYRVRVEGVPGVRMRRRWCVLRVTMLGIRR